MASYGKILERLLPDVVLCVSQNGEGQTLLSVSLGKYLSFKTPKKGHAFNENLYYECLCGKSLLRTPLWRIYVKNTFVANLY